MFNEKKIPSFVKRLNKHLKQQTKVMSDEVIMLKDNLKKVNGKLNNIIKAVEDGMPQSSFAERLSALEDEKYKLEARIDSICNNAQTPTATEDDILFAIKRIRKFISTNNLPECKQLIADYVEKVVVYKEHVELVLKTGFNIVDNAVETHKIDKKSMYESSGYRKSS